MRFVLSLGLAIAAIVGSSSAVRAQDDTVPDQDVLVPLPETGVVRIRINEEIGTDASAIKDAIGRHSGWKIAEPADYEIIRDPEFFMDVVLVPLKREGRDIAPAYREQLSRDGPMDALQVLDYYTEPFHQEVAWASNVPEPIYLGGIDEAEFGDRFDSFAAPIAVRASLLDLESMPQQRTTSVCVSLEAPPAGYCPIRSSDGLMEIPRGANTTVTIKLDRRLDRHVHALALAPDNSVQLLFSSPPAQLYADQSGHQNHAGFETVAYIDNADVPVQFGQLGLYKIVTIASEHPLNPLIFAEHATDDAGVRAPSVLCLNGLEQQLCQSLFGTKTEQSGYINLGDTDVAVTDLYSAGPIKPTQYIIGGHTVSRRDALWQVQLFRPVRGAPLGRSGRRQGNAHRMNFEKAHHCGGSYIGGGFIVTAAHCVRHEPLGNSKPDMFVRMGTLDIAAGGVSFGIDSIMIHAGYRKKPNYDDIALVRINPSQMSAVNNLVSQGKLAPISYRAAAARVGSKLLVTGWGFQGRTLDNGILDIKQNTQRSPRRLEGVTLTSQRSSACAQIGTYSGFSLSKIVCAASPGQFRDACYKDSGGPLTRSSGNSRVLVGIVSAGNGCAITRGAPGIYTSVAPYRSWIDRAKRKARSNRRVFVP